jgi:hypothetical protein
MLFPQGTPQIRKKTINSCHSKKKEEQFKRKKSDFVRGEWIRIVMGFDDQQGLAIFPCS